MKNVLALSLSLLMPVAPVLAQTPPDQSPQSAAITAKETASGSQIANDMGTQPVVAAPPSAAPLAGPSGAAPDTTQAAQHSTDLRVNVGNISEPAASPEKKKSFFSKLKDNVINFATKHPVLTGAILGGLLCIAGGPAIFVIGVSLGAVAGDMTSYLLKKHAKSES
jgi:hypothetical protein